MEDVKEYLHRWEHDACALIAGVAKSGSPEAGLLPEIIAALDQMAHRSGDVYGEGDGCGVQTDIPRALWSARLAAAGFEPNLAYSSGLGVGHFFIPRSEAYWTKALKEEIGRRFAADGVEVLLSLEGQVNPAALGPRGTADAPEFWQVAVKVPQGGPAADRLLFRLALAVEEDTPVHVLSFSTETVVYKVRGGPGTLRSYYDDLNHADFATRAVIGHNRYSTNTATAFERVQPFTLLGHNGEINTIRKLRDEARLLGIPITRGGSDSQDLNRTLEGLIQQNGLSLMESAEMVFPPIINEIKQYSLELQDFYMYCRQAFGPFTQGPAAIAARYRDEMIFCIDAMGLRPLWMVETADRFIFSSEHGVVPANALVADPKPLAPGEKVGALLRPGGVDILTYPEIQRRVLGLSRQRFPAPEGWRRYIETGRPGGFQIPELHYQPGPAHGWELLPGGRGPEEALLAAFGWAGDDHQIIRAQSQNGAEPIGSLGYDGPLACLGEHRQNLADYFKESVAVVTNPAVDREREIEHFSTRTVLGVRPPVAVLSPGDRAVRLRTRIELRAPLVLGGHAGTPPMELDEYKALATKQGTLLLEDLIREFDPIYGTERDPGIVRPLDTVYSPSESLAQALARLQREAVQAVLEGAELLVLDDRYAFTDEHLWMDPHLALAAVDQALRKHKLDPGQPNLRRRCSLVLRSGALRNLHDLVLALGLGADVLAPYLMLEVAALEGEKGVESLVTSMQKGFEKVLSTLGMHEVRGYGRQFGSLGLKPEVARYFDCENYYGSDRGGLGLGRLKADAGVRYHVVTGDANPKMARPFRIWPRVWKIAGDAAQGKAAYRDFADKLLLIEKETPVSLRHLLDLRPGTPVPAAAVDTSIEDYTYPVYIAGMSFGSQGEIAFRAYAEAAKRLDIIAMNGEGGEIPDMVGKYWKWRSQQVASGRFGVNADMLVGSRFMEIKVGQGAKPGEGGHLPGKKVSAKVARARNATPGSDLISPSNNHDVYSIEDLAQLVDELKTVNPQGKVVVKVPVVPGIGTIAVGVAKSGADVVALCGYDGGTGAARRHALRHAGLPVEVGVREAHLALLASGIRDRVEIWGDSGVKSGLDVVKLMLLGANRVGFGTMAMVAIGCTICRGCQLDTCHVGIATQIETVEQAHDHGLKHFVPRVHEEATQRLMNLFTAIGDEVRELTAALGCHRSQDLVGRSDLLVQTRGLGQVDLDDLVAAPPASFAVGDVCGGTVRQVANPMTRELAAVAAGHWSEGRANRFTVPQALTRDRSLGTYLSGEVARQIHREGREALTEWQAEFYFADGSIPGNGLGAFNMAGVRLVVPGGAGDGVGKGMLGGEVAVLKARNERGELVGGCVGKGCGYGAQRGRLIVQGDADARFGIRLSGADVIIGGQMRAPLTDGQGAIAARANIKGFAFEYMTQGRAVVLGDPGPWICSGMTGGVVFCRLVPDLGLDEAALKRRLAKGARASIGAIGDEGKKDLTELLSAYHQVLLDAGQEQEAAEVLSLMLECERHFVAIRPVKLQADQTVSTE